MASGAGEERRLVAGGVMRPALYEGGTRAETEGLEGVLDLEAAALAALDCCALSVVLSMLLRHLLNRLAALGVAKLVRLARA